MRGGGRGASPTGDSTPCCRRAYGREGCCGSCGGAGIRRRSRSLPPEVDLGLHPRELLLRLDPGPFLVLEPQSQLCTAPAAAQALKSSSTRCTASLSLAAYHAVVLVLLRAGPTPRAPPREAAANRRRPRPLPLQRAAVRRGSLAWRRRRCCPCRRAATTAASATFLRHRQRCRSGGDAPAWCRGRRRRCRHDNARRHSCNSDGQTAGRRPRRPR